MPLGTVSEVSFTSAAFSPKIARRRRSSGASSVSLFGRDLADQDVAGLHFGPDANDAIGAEIAQRFLGDIRDVPGDFLRSELGIAGADLEFVDVDRGIDILLHDLLGDGDGVLEVIAIPRHERDEHVAAEGQLAILAVRAVGDDVALLDLLAFLDDRALIDAGAGIRAHELAQLVDEHAAFEVVLELLLALGHLAVRRDDDLLGGDAGDLAIRLAHHHGARVAGDLALHAGADERRLGNEERHALALHVRAHQRAVRVVVLEEGNQAGGHGDELLRRDVHVVDLGRLDLEEVAAITHGHLIGEELALLVDRHIRLRDEVVLLAVAGEEVDLVGDAAVDHLAVRRLDEAEVIDPRKGGHRRDEADVRTFRRLDRTDAAVVRGMHVAHLEAGAIAREAAWPKGRQTALVGQLGERIGLIHELRELGAPEEIADHGGERLRIDQLLRRHALDVHVEQGHALLDQALGAGEAHAALVGEQLAHGADAAGAEVIDIIEHALALRGAG